MGQKFLFYAACVVGLVILLNGEGYACSCVPHEGEPLAKQVREAKTHADAVFTGEVLRISENLEEEYVSIEIRLIGLWKGNLRKKVTILTGLHDGNCRYKFRLGETYLVYASNLTMYSPTRSLSTHMCHRTAVLSEGKADIRYLGTQKKILGT